MSTSANPLLAPWTGPHGGVPPFDTARVEHFEPALEAGMAAQLAEVEAIASNPEPATFDNTLAALEAAGDLLDRVQAVYWVFKATMITPEVQKVSARMAPRLAAFQDRITQNTALFARIDAVRSGPEFATLNPEQQRLVTTVYDAFVRHGARLDGAAKERLGAINQELAALYTQFGENMLADEETYIVLDGEADLAGLPPALVDAAASQASALGLAGQWVVVNTRSSVDPFLATSTRRDLREKVWRAFVSRGDNGDQNDNNALIPKILALRAERAGLLGFATHAHWQLHDSMARTPEAAMVLMETVWKASVARVHQEVADMQALADSEGAGITIAPWDYAFYQEKVRKARYDLDQDEITPYLQLDRLREGMFWVAGELYGLHFAPRTDVPVVHPDIRVWEVSRGGEHVGLFYFDPYGRKGKRSGAWMNAYRMQEGFRGRVRPIVSNNENYVKAPEGRPTLISWDDANTLFHEFGHALHGLLSDVTWPTLAGTSVPRDYVEFPSQLHEHWLGTPEMLSRFATHVETGEPIPAELVLRIKAAGTFNQGFRTTEFLASALMDMKLHLAGSTPIDPKAFERDTLAELGMPDALVMRHRLPHFAHIFSSDGYSASYYAYLWADTLVADAAEAFKDAGSMYDVDTARSLFENVLSVGNTIDPAEGFRTFRGRDVDATALMRDRGFV